MTQEYGGFRKIEVLNTAPLDYLLEKHAESLQSMHAAYKDSVKLQGNSSDPNDPVDWIRREIVTAFRLGLTVYLVLQSLEPTSALLYEDLLGRSTGEFAAWLENAEK
jgi:hypothetical protein